MRLILDMIVFRINIRFVMKSFLVMFILFNSLLFSNEVSVSFSGTTPPYVFKDGTGIAASLVKEALKYRGHTMKAELINISRGIEMFKNGYVDANALVKKNLRLTGFYSDYFIQYHNAAFTLKSSQIKLEKFEDLSKYSLLSFQNANVLLGEKFHEITQKAGKKYSEIANQKQQVHMFLHGRVETIVMDRNIYKYYKNLLIKEKAVDASIEEDIHEFFEPTEYRVIFKDKKIRDDFNEGIKFIKENGKYEAIYKKYSENYFKIEVK